MQGSSSSSLRRRCQFPEPQATQGLLPWSAEQLCGGYAGYFAAQIPERAIESGVGDIVGALGFGGRDQGFIAGIAFLRDAGCREGWWASAALVAGAAQQAALEIAAEEAQAEALADAGGN